MKSLTRRIKHQETTAANYTAMVSRMAADTTRESAVEVSAGPSSAVERLGLTPFSLTPLHAQFFSRWGEVVHVTISYKNRKLIFASRALAAAVQQHSPARLLT